MARRPARDINKAAFNLVREATKKKNRHAIALGRLGGLKGGKARAEKLSEARRSEIAQKAALTRWKNRTTN